MRHQAAILALLAVALVGCYSQGPIVYTGTNEDARDGDWIKDPEAEGTTRDSTNRKDQTRTLSNRVDIPVLEYAQMSVTSYGYGARRHSGYDARFTRMRYEAGRHTEYTQYDAALTWVDRHVGAEAAFADLNETLYPGLRNQDMLNARSGRDRTRAYSALEQPWTEANRAAVDGIRTRSWTNAVKGEAWLEAYRGTEGYELAHGSRVIGLHLWKYADRDLVTDAVEVTYTIVYYNMNEYDIGPTEIQEPIPYYTQFIEKTATLPKEGTSVEYVKGEGTRNFLRWKFPKGIKAGETNKMTYKVRVELESKYTPPDDNPRTAPEPR